MSRIDPEVFAYHRRHADMLRRAAIRRAIAAAGAGLRHGMARLIGHFIAPGATPLRADR